MNKIILVHYINIGQSNTVRTRDGLLRYRQGLNQLEESDDIINFIIPVHTGESRIECINPKLVSETEYQSALAIVTEARKKLDEFLYAKQETKEENGPCVEEKRREA